MQGREKGCSLPLVFILLFICTTGYATTDLDDSKEEDVLGAALPPLKLGHSVCAMKADEGPCKAIHMRYYFNIQSRECEIFEYGGCHGNENNFLTLEECQKKCVVTVSSSFQYSRSSHTNEVILQSTRTSFCATSLLRRTKKGKMCRILPSSVTAKTPDITELPLKVMSAKIKKEKPNFCFHEKDPGICRGYFSRYFYNKETKICEVFKYGGCLGNQNNFKNLEECQTTCQGNSNVLPILPNEEHPNTRNTSSPEGEPNQLPGISVNLFPTTSNEKSHTVNISSPKEERNQFPIFFEPPTIPSLCMTPMDRGLCRARELRFYYNYSTGRCHPFSYSGCGGNENNFTSRKSCLRICKKGFNETKSKRRLIKIKKKRKKQSVKAMGKEITPERTQL